MKDLAEVLSTRTAYGRGLGVFVGTIASIYVMTRGFYFLR